MKTRPALPIVILMILIGLLPASGQEAVTPGFSPAELETSLSNPDLLASFNALVNGLLEVKYPGRVLFDGDLPVKSPDEFDVKSATGRAIIGAINMAFDSPALVIKVPFTFDASLTAEALGIKDHFDGNTKGTLTIRYSLNPIAGGTTLHVHFDEADVVKGAIKASIRTALSKTLNDTFAAKAGQFDALIRKSIAGEDTRAERKEIQTAFQSVGKHLTNNVIAQLKAAPGDFLKELRGDTEKIVGKAVDELKEAKDTVEEEGKKLLNKAEITAKKTVNRSKEKIKEAEAKGKEIINDAGTVLQKGINKLFR